ncbi:hypothetical protein ABZY06_33850 [Streptomyces sp. NPDC006540]|uniref:recombination directionality factor n=1 Tax=Streptomyces sp. NPDC006540 TaxID=3155353 RepID=UPI0033B183C1
MALKIWQTDPENKPEPAKSYDSDLDGAFSIGAQDKEGNPVALDTFRVSLSDPNKADAIAQLFGGSVVETDRTNEHYIDVTTARDKVLVIVEDPKALYADMKKWDNGKLTHHCDGEIFISHPINEKLIGSACGCPELFVERKQHAKAGLGPKPAIELTFRLADDPDLGVFKFKTSAWTLAKVLHEAEEALERINGEALVELSLTLVEFVIKKGKDKGTQVSYYAPGIKVLKSYQSAIAEGE